MHPQLSSVDAILGAPSTGADGPVGAGRLLPPAAPLANALIRGRSAFRSGPAASSAGGATCRPITLTEDFHFSTVFKRTTGAGPAAWRRFARQSGAVS